MPALVKMQPAKSVEPSEICRTQQNLSNLDARRDWLRNDEESGKGQEALEEVDQDPAGNPARRVGAELQFCYYDSGVVNGAIV
jgi:hypothetical protein